MSTRTPDAEAKQVLEPEHEESFAEAAFKLAGKSEDEARRTGAIDRADDQVERLFLPQYQTVNSPVHRAVWDRTFPVDLFRPEPLSTPPDVQKVMDDSVAVVQRHRQAGTLHNQDRKISDEVLADLAGAGYWGLLVSKEYGGSGAPFRSFASFLTRMATVDPTVAGLASVHGCIGAVDPVRTFGSEEQKRRFLCKLASGERLSGFALTEPGAGSDLTALSTTARLDGDDYVVNGEKLFITNAVPGRTVGLVCLIEGKPAVLICDLPDRETDQFQIKKYGLYALKHTYNNGLVFNDFRVPKENLLTVPRGDGLTIAYHGLNLGRVALCATAAGTMRLMLASMIPWAHYRVTYSEPIARRELVQRRLGKLAGMIVAADALVAWCSTLLDAGYRGEMECIVAKIFGSEAQKEAAIDLFMKTHGGRSFLHGHMFGDNVHEYLAPCIYEGEGEMLGMAFFKSLVKQHGVAYFQVIGEAMKKAGIRNPNFFNPLHVWAMRKGFPYARWLVAEKFRSKPMPSVGAMPGQLREHAEFAIRSLQHAPLRISGAMSKHQLKLADRQCRMSDMSARVQKMVVILCTSLYAASQEDAAVREAANIYCGELRRELLGQRPSDRDFRAATQLGESIAAGGFPGITDLHPDEIMMQYK
jgi:alkylation response protein AidB-like acyl-CoA dehydrogenase